MSAMAVKFSPSITWSTFSGQPSVSYQKCFVSRQYGRESRYPRHATSPHMPESPSPKVLGHFIRQALCMVSECETAVALTQVSACSMHKNLAVRKIMEVMRTARVRKKQDSVSTRLKLHMRQTITEGTRVLWKESVHRLNVRSRCD